MKKKQEKRLLSINKFTVSRLNNLRTIMGGDDQDKTGKKSKKCPPPPPPSGPICPTPQPDDNPDN